jgi:Hsp70 protein
MADAIGLSIGATRFAGVQLGRAPVIRHSVLTLYRHRSPELGVRAENPNITAPGVVVTGFVERVGDPVGMVAADGSMHRGELLVADALRELLYTVTDGRPPATPATVTYPAHWRRPAVDALRTALTQVPEWTRRGHPITLVSDAAAAIAALQSHPGVPSHGVIVLCDFGGTGTSIALLDASRGYAPVGRTVRHTDFSGDLIDQALLTHVVAGPSALVSVDATGTSALGPLHRLRGQCRGAKERLSSSAVTALHVELPGFRGNVRVTRAELEEQIRRPVADLLAVVQDTIHRSGIHPSDLVAVTSVGGGARIPLVTAMLSERFRIPVITTARPELAAMSGAALRAAWGPADERSTALAPAVAAPFAEADAQSTTFRALAWSEAHDVPPVAPYDEPFDDELFDDEFAPASLSSARPQLEFAAASAPVAVALPWYRRPSSLLGAAGAAVMLLAASAVVAFGSESTPASSNTMPLTPSTTVAATGAPATPPGKSSEPRPQPQPQEQPQSQEPPQRTIYAVPPPATQYEAPASASRSESLPPPPPPETTTVTSTTEAPASTTTVTSTTQAPASTTTVATPTPTPPPASEPTTQASAPTTTAPPVTFTLPPIPRIPGILNPRR